MKIGYATAFLLSALVVCGVAKEEPKLLRVPFTKKKIANGLQSLHKRQFTEKLYNDFGSIYIININIGTPPQTFQVALDTGRYIKTNKKKLLIFDLRIFIYHSL
jgi:hypothetical protein